MKLSLLIFGKLAALVLSREITFPPIAAVNPYQTTLGANLDDVDIISPSQFSGLLTFAHVPYIQCFDDKIDVPKYDIAFLGAPFDTVSRFLSSAHCWRRSKRDIPRRITASLGFLGMTLCS